MIDQWAVFFVGAMLGMLLPTILMAHMVATSGEQADPANVPTFSAEQLGELYGQGMFYLMLVVGRARPVLHAARHLRGAGAQLHRRRARVCPGCAGGSRATRAVLLPVHAAGAGDHRGALHLALPVELVQISANMSNLGALMFPFALIYLNSRLPKAARPRCGTT